MTGGTGGGEAAGTKTPGRAPRPRPCALGPSTAHWGGRLASRSSSFKIRLSVPA